MNLWKLSVLFVLSIMITSIWIHETKDAYAITKSTIDRLSPNAFGIQTNVCGDHLCDEKKMKSDEPSIKLIDVYPLGKNKFKTLIQTSLPTEKTNATSIYLSSDYETKKIISLPLSPLSEYKVSIIRAFDPSTIEIIKNLSNQGTLISSEPPEVKLIVIDSITSQSNLYRVVFEVKSPDYNMKDIKIKIFSDIDSTTYSIDGIFKNSSHTNQIKIKATDPKSIGILVLDHEINR